jgi:hypothetical protein
MGIRVHPTISKGGHQRMKPTSDTPASSKEHLCSYQTKPNQTKSTNKHNQPTQIFALNSTQLTSRNLRQVASCRSAVASSLTAGQLALPILSKLLLLLLVLLPLTLPLLLLILVTAEDVTKQDCSCACIKSRSSLASRFAPNVISAADVPEPVPEPAAEDVPTFVEEEEEEDTGTATAGDPAVAGM